METVRYPSKRDLWLTILLWVSALGMLTAAFSFWKTQAPLAVRLAFGLLMVLAVLLVISVLYRTYYVLTANVLLIRSGPFTWKIRLDSIEGVVQSQSLLSAPACSLDRLHIQYRGSRLGVLISPENQRKFLEDLELRRRTPQGWLA